MTGHTVRMKTAISLPDDLYDAIDAAARELKMTRSGLLAAAARQFLAARGASDPTAAWNRAIAEAGQPGDDPAARALRHRSRVDGWRPVHGDDRR
jgi:predicted transcriptional regulator